MKINLIIAGIGGQGINSLAKVLAEYYLQTGYYCQFTVHKGGAQSLGSVYAELRISDQESIILGQGIPSGQLDILIALEPWEALRHVSLAHSKSQLCVETKMMPLFVERSKERKIIPAKNQLDALPLNIQWSSYQEIALQKSGSIKMANYYAGLDCVTAHNTLTGELDLELYDKLFFKLVKKASKK